MPKAKVKKREKPVSQLQIAAAVELANRLHARVDGVEYAQSNARQHAGDLHSTIAKVSKWVNDDRATIACLAAKKDQFEAQVKQDRTMLVNGHNDMLNRVVKLEAAICPRVAARLTGLEKDAVRGAAIDVKFEERLEKLEKNLFNLSQDYHLSNRLNGWPTTSVTPKQAAAGRWPSSEGFNRLWADLQADRVAQRNARSEREWNPEKDTGTVQPAGTRAKLMQEARTAAILDAVARLLATGLDSPAFSVRVAALRVAFTKK